MSPLLKNKAICISDRYCLSSLLPYDPRNKFRAALRAGLNEYLFLLTGSIKAFDALELNDLEKFDALVGENACQIRAICISIIALKKEGGFSSLRNKINKAKDNIYKLLEEKTVSKLMRVGVSLAELFANEKLFILFNFQEVFIIHCFLLREVKSSNHKDNLLDNLLIKEKCIPKRLKKIGNVSSSFADNLVSKLRKNTAKKSVRFIREYASKSKDKGLIRMLSDEFTINHNNHLLCTPMFWTYKAVLFAAKVEKVKIILHVKSLDNKGSYFEVSDEHWFDSELTANTNIKGSELSIKKLSWDKIDKKPCIVFQGVACSNNNAFFSRDKWELELLRFPINTIILAGAADHRQYPNEKDNDRFFQLFQDLEYETYKSLAREEGFSFENPSTFFIQHVYATNTETLILRAPSISNGH